jgi:hypothetical protein
MDVFRRNTLTSTVILSLCIAVTFSVSGTIAHYHQEPENRQSNSIRGVVLDREVGVPGAIVRIQATDRSTVSGAHGSFEMSTAGMIDTSFKLTAWARGYYIAGPVSVKSGERDVEIHLLPHGTRDNPGYQWLPTTGIKGEGENQACAACHSSKGTSLSYTLPVDEWLLDAHSQAARNPRFLSMFSGRDITGNMSKPTRYFQTRDYGTLPLPPDTSQKYYGPGFKLDFPDKNGNCASCHAPVAAISAPYDTDPVSVSGVGAEGVNCDFCHKVWDVRLDPVSGLPFENRPGVLSFELRRPFGKHQFFAGPLDDVAPGEDTYSPLQRESQICAPCHHGVFWGTTIYNSFGEWLASPYSHPKNGKTCQGCHMPQTGARYFTRPDKGGLNRDPGKIFNHRMPGAMDKQLLANAVTMSVTAARRHEEIAVSVSIVNDLTGHHVPTDSPLRHLILLVKATDRKGIILQQTGGPKLPDWCGVGNPANDCYAGLPGKAFAKILKEEWTHISPTGSYWNPTRIVSDNRIAALATDISNYTFTSKRKGAMSVHVILLFRRAYKELMDQKGWQIPDIIMEQESIIL